MNSWLKTAAADEVSWLNSRLKTVSADEVSWLNSWLETAAAAVQLKARALPGMLLRCLNCGLLALWRGFMRSAAWNDVSGAV